ncbi:YebY family protein [Pseudomonas sp. 5P_3.1_Bac2]|uniref:YebY family protein n=1 Tax=Pseudomonas sp. 5P_3.1_Bac2 TaxID=2971617 RepID=UPI0021C8FC72|nr:YebY family protein [Pseudomonas sp. 5P_3.1_Bac2]MCU1716804.1 YebY family protein [Pseudomonas sp. 5P_3.1_Bac2]
MGFKGLLTWFGVAGATVVAAGDTLMINAQEYGEAWPFTVAEVQLQCHPGMVLLVKDLESGDSYPINGAASASADKLKLKPLENIWRSDPQVEDAKISLNPVIQRGISLCVD